METTSHFPDFFSTVCSFNRLSNIEYKELPILIGNFSVTYMNPQNV